MPENEDQADGANRDDLELIKSLAREAGQIALSHQNAGLKSWTKSDNTPVSHADLAVDAYLRDRLTAARPNYGWLSEESAAAPARNSRRTFVVDPIDGTRAFLNNRDTWTVCLAILEDDTVVAAAVMRPAGDKLYSSARGLGAHLNDDPIFVSERTTLSGMRVAGGEGVYAKAPPIAALDPSVEFIGATSMALRLCHVAAGDCDATVALSAKSDWDLAAGMLLVQEAGGTVSDQKGCPLPLFKNRRHGSVVAANFTLHSQLIALLAVGDPLDENLAR